MKLRQKGLVAAMEEENLPIETPTETPDPVEVVPETQVDAEVAANDVEQGAAEIEEMQVLAEEAIDDIGTLENTTDVLEQTIPNGGAEPAAAELANIVVESICARLGIRPTKRVIPAKENFALASRLPATKVAVENANQTMDRAWEGVKNFFVKIGEKIQEFLATFFANSEKVKAHAETLKTKLEGLRGKKVKDGAEITIPGGIAKALLKTNTPDANEFDSVVEAHAKATDLTDKLADTIKEIFVIMSEGVKSLGSEGAAAKLEAAGGEVAKKLEGILTGSFKVTKSEGGFIAELGPFLNGATLKVTADGAKGEVDLAVVSGEGEPETTFAPASIDMCEHFVSSTIELMVKTNHLKDVMSGKVKEALAESVKMIDGVIKAVKAPDSAEGIQGALTKIRTASTKTAGFINRWVTLLPAANVKLGKQMLDIVEASLKHVEGEEKAAE